LLPPQSEPLRRRSPSNSSKFPRSAISPHCPTHEGAQGTGPPRPARRHCYPSPGCHSGSAAAKPVRTAEQVGSLYIGLSRPVAPLLAARGEDFHSAGTPLVLRAG